MKKRKDFRQKAGSCHFAEGRRRASLCGRRRPTDSHGPKRQGGFISYLAKPCPGANFLQRAWGFLGNPLFCLFSEGTRQSGREGSLQRFTSLPVLLGL